MAFLYYILVVVDALNPSAATNKAVAKLFPLFFALGVFLTLAYYVLDHPNPKNLDQKNYWFNNGYPYVHYSSHLEHCLALPMVLLHSLTLTSKSGAPSNFDNIMAVGTYMAFYLGGTHVNQYVTGHWVYPICDDITNEHGDMGRNIFFAVLVATNFMFGKIGLTIVQMRRVGTKRKSA
eukprot:CAMPEP_0182563960 /NCGR_PEP_ID=MMETSP1324-20130603/6003_1 /TAXON_ID=236786 /ORGANISM="Florenciella sp., Strain RCC1587" /LENGTH=177 /DNA_ID=CAMNT_0024777301 /DNA_START=186 /DNA_END=719 /DNA_ORIENTATION=+